MIIRFKGSEIPTEHEWFSQTKWKHIKNRNYSKNELNNNSDNGIRHDNALGECIYCEKLQGVHITHYTWPSIVFRYDLQSDISSQLASKSPANSVLSMHRNFFTLPDNCCKNSKPRSATYYLQTILWEVSTTLLLLLLINNLGKCDFTAYNMNVVYSFAQLISLKSIIIVYFYVKGCTSKQTTPIIKKPTNGVASFHQNQIYNTYLFLAFNSSWLWPSKFWCID